MFTIGIIGRPNVGKSTLFNRLAGRRIAIVEDRPGVTRDNIEFTSTWLGRTFRVIDTAGFDLGDTVIREETRKQFANAIVEADFIIVLVDAIEGLHPLDEIVVRELRMQGREFMLVVNKVDNQQRENDAVEFYTLGVDEYTTISASHGRNIDEMLDKILPLIDDYNEKSANVDEDLRSFLDNDSIKISIVGKPNVGKSSLFNAWLNQDRSIVTPQAGTTRDAVFTAFNVNDTDYTLIDTAGIRKKSIMFRDAVDRFSYYRSMDAMELADIAICVIDGSEGLTSRDIKIIADAWEAGRPVVIVVNKWDLTKGEKDARKELVEDIRYHLKFLHNPPVIFTSALTKSNIFKVFPEINKLHKIYTKRIETNKVNELLQHALMKHQPPILNNNRRLKFYYATQVASKPPTFALFVNFPELVHFSYHRFLTNEIRDAFKFDAVPIRLLLRQRASKERS